MTHHPDPVADAMLKNLCRGVDLVQQAMHTPPRSDPMPTPTPNGSVDAQERLDNLSDGELLDHCEGELGDLEAQWIDLNQDDLLRQFRETPTLGLWYDRLTAKSQWASVGEHLHRKMEVWAVQQLRSRIGANLALGVVPDFLMGE